MYSHCTSQAGNNKHMLVCSFVVTIKGKHCFLQCDQLYFHIEDKVNNKQGTKNISILHLSCRTSDNFHSTCKHMHSSFKRICNKEHKGVIFNRTSSSYSSQSTHPVRKCLGKN